MSLIDNGFADIGLLPLPTAKGAGFRFGNPLTAIALCKRIIIQLGNRSSPTYDVGQNTASRHHRISFI